MMNKTKVIEKYQSTLKTLDEPAHAIVMSAGSALVLLGIRNKTDMVNISVSPNLFRYLGIKKSVIQRKDTQPYIQLDKELRVHLIDDNIGVACVDGVWIYSLSELLKQKQKVTAHPNRLPVNKKRDEQEMRLLQEMIKAGKTVSRMV